METVVLAAFLATSTMTAFSYLLSASFRKLYKEPLLLQFVMNRLHLELHGVVRWCAAWILHYAIGVLFVVGFDLVISETPSWIDALLFGSIIGIISIFGWAIMFNFAGKPKQTDWRGYFAQLFAAHLIFAFTTVAVYRLV